MSAKALFAYKTGIPQFGVSRLLLKGKWYVRATYYSRYKNLIQINTHQVTHDFYYKLSRQN